MPNASRRLNRVLLVDADVRTNQRLAGLLEEDGFVVEVVRDGPDAIRHLAQPSAPNILITELQVPLSDGVTIARLARVQNPEVRIVVLTRYANQRLPAAFGRRPPVVLSKPLDYAHLLEILERDAPEGGSPAASAG